MSESNGARGAIFVLCAYCQEEDSLYIGESENVCRRCKRTTEFFWSVPDVDGNPKQLLGSNLKGGPTSEQG